ncbi:ribokinase [Bacillus sp. M6-12]|uniref:ribokinase n=1 Tax=Bacillus sp. M6-12 TaxID=2054166 RepID=UPI000C755F29|nr:ribokinase [Bacillus sp. M6-12]PLS15752.1 ribokinase [Bacillus sp. M6-12]
MKKPVITVLGSINMDLVTVTNLIPNQGETLIGQSFSTFPGGKGANQAVAAARLGAEVCMLGKVGADLFGSKLKDILRQEGVNEKYVDIATENETGTATIIVSNHDNRIIVVPGANNEVTPEWVIAHEEQIQNSDLLLLQLEIPIESVITATEIANKYGIPVILNPAPFQNIPKNLLEGLTYITPNEHEYKQLLDQATNEEIEQIKDKSIVTKGEKGVEFHLNNQKTTINAITVEVLDTTGAGDTFNGALAVALSKKHNLKDAVLFATVAASISTTKMGAQTGMPALTEIEDVLNQKKLSFGVR